MKVVAKGLSWYRHRSFMFDRDAASFHMNRFKSSTWKSGLINSRTFAKSWVGGRSWCI
jgi:hypothetical protein